MTTASVIADSSNLAPRRSPEYGDEQVLVDALLRDDAAAWRTFNERYGRMIHRCITRITVRFSSVVSADDVREIYATFCLQLLANDKSKLRSYAPDRGSSFGSWLALLAAHAAYDFLRRRRREPAFEDADDEVAVTDSVPDPYELCEIRERATIAAAMIAHFSERDREFLTLFYGEGLEPEQIARRMRISVKTVYSKKHKIQSRLEALMQRRRLAA
jgi:RNA polymerase sigma-70 factor, ECF subfamily